MSPKVSSTKDTGAAAPPKHNYLLFDASRTFLLNSVLPEGRRLDLPALANLVQTLLSERENPSDFITHLFTSVDKKNTGQLKYLDTFANTFSDTRIHECPPWEADAFNPAIWDDSRGQEYRHTSSSAKIAFFLGAFYAKQSANRIMLITDAFDLKDPILSCISAGIPVSIIWFGQFIDPRYRPFFRETPSLEFVDLDQHPDVLGGSPRPHAGFEKLGLNPFA